jgi:glycosyltransferase involved in cell wall biosynthesis
MHRDLCSARRSLILVDEPVEGDGRVGRSLDALPGAEILDIREPGAASVWRSAAAASTAIWLIVAALCSSPFARKRRIALLLQDMVRDGPAGGLASAYTWTYRAVRAARALKRSSGGFSVVHAHDLYCGLCAVSVVPSQDCRLIYDAHELEIHRNRRAGWLRILVEHCFERRILQRADEIIVVNQAIAEAVRTLYAISAPNIRIEYNDFYAHHPVPRPEAGHRPCIVYVGKGVHGRQLEHLDRSEDELGFSVHGYFLGKDLPESLSGRSWRLGPVDYEADLLSLVKSRRCLMWCCLDARVLSYKLALPNKFFQALAVGIPVIASPRTYLAELVDRYRLGVILDGLAGVAPLARRVQSPEFEQWVGAVAEFRDALRQGAVVI